MPERPFGGGSPRKLNMGDIVSPDRKRRSFSGPSPHLELASTSSHYESPSPPYDERTLSPTQGNSQISGNGNPLARDGEDSLTLRRREANRLAAQRFRSRKKGYQDSLEERIRMLEDEKDGMARRLQDSRRGDSGNQHPLSTHPRSPSQERLPIDIDVRVASLESANRRLQDELRLVSEENDRLRDEIEHYRQREYRNGQRSRDGDRYARPGLAPLDFGPMPPPFSTYPHTPSGHPPLERGHSYSHPFRHHSPGPRLPPLRLPPSADGVTVPPILPFDGSHSNPRSDPRQIAKP